MPEAARISDMHQCPDVAGSAPHIGGPIFAGSADVVVGHLPAARVGDSMVCFPVGVADSIKKGSGTVLINYCQAARRTDPGNHKPGDVIVQGCPTVIIGDTPQQFPMREAAVVGTPLCEVCERPQGDYGEHPAETAAPPAEADTVTLAGSEPMPGRRDTLTNLDESRADLAKQPDRGDPLDDVRRAARQAVAFQFYAQKAGLSADPAKIWSHIGGIDIKKPVEVVEAAGRTLYQRGFPGGRNGEYFATDEKATPEELGASSQVAVDDGSGTGKRKLVPRDRRTITFDDKPPAAGLKSTAAPIQDFWSIGKTASEPGQLVACEGGGTQIMIPRALQVATNTTMR